MFPLFGGQSQYEPLYFQTVELMVMTQLIPGNCVGGVPGQVTGRMVRCSTGDPGNWVQVIALPLSR